MGYCLCVNYVLNNFMFIFLKFSKFNPSFHAFFSNLEGISGFIEHKLLIIRGFNIIQDLKKWTF